MFYLTLFFVILRRLQWRCFEFKLRELFCSWLYNLQYRVARFNRGRKVIFMSAKLAIFT